MSNLAVEFYANEPCGYWFDYLLDDVDRAQIHAMFRTHQRPYKAGSLLRGETDESRAIYVTLSGWAALSKSLPEGQTQIIDFSLPGDFFNLTSADNETAAFNFETITDATIAIVPIDDWYAMMRDFPQMAKITELQARATNSRVAERMLRLGRGSAEKRLAYAFLELGIRSGALFDHNNSNFHIPVTQQQIGDFMGLTSVHVCRILRRLADDGVLSTSQHIKLCLSDLVALEKMAGISIATLSKEILPIG